MANTRGIRKVGENVLANGRAIIVTEKDKNKYSWSEIPVGSKFIDTRTGIEQVKLEGETDWVPSGVKNDGTLSIAKDTRLMQEVFTITEINFPNKTFRYKNTDGSFRDSVILYDDITKEKQYVFTLENGDYMPERNLLMVKLNDTLERSTISGGLREITNRRFSILDDIQVGDEVTATYAEKINIGNPYPRFFISATPPDKPEEGDLWIDTNPAPYRVREVAVNG